MDHLARRPGPAGRPRGAGAGGSMAGKRSNRRLRALLAGWIHRRTLEPRRRARGGLPVHAPRPRRGVPIFVIATRIVASDPAGGYRAHRPRPVFLEPHRNDRPMPHR